MVSLLEGGRWADHMPPTHAIVTVWRLRKSLRSVLIAHNVSIRWKILQRLVPVILHHLIIEHLVTAVDRLILIILLLLLMLLLEVPLYKLLLAQQLFDWLLHE